MAKFSDEKLFRFLNPTLVAKKSGLLGQGFFLLGILLIILSLARPGGNPQFQEEEVDQKGVDIMLLVDLSSSMKATDLAPSRIQATKTALKNFIDKISNDRIGLVVFAGMAALQSPLTQDYRTAKMMVDIINTDFLPLDGTAIGDAINHAMEKIGKDNQKTAVLVLLTDGENTKGADPMEAAKKAKTAGTKIFTIGVGTDNGGKIPETKSPSGFKQYMGQDVVSKLDKDLLQKIAQETGGKSFLADTSQSLMQAYAQISGLTKTEHREKKKKVKYQEYYIWLAIPGLFLLLVDLYINRRSSWWARKAKAVKNGKV
jgi:Ca-activated chloride channel family protein